MGACGSSSKKNNCSNCPGNPRDCLQPFTVSAKNFTKNSRPVHGQSYGTKPALPPHMTKNAKLFAWDFHGTLEEGVEVGFFEILKQLKKEYKTEVKITLSEVRKKYGVSVADYLRHFFPKANLSQIKTMMKKIAQIQNQEHLKKFVQPGPYAVEVLRKIKRAGFENIVLSNSHPKHIEPLIMLVGMKNLISKVYAVDRHYSHKKQNPTEEKAKILKI